MADSSFVQALLETWHNHRIPIIFFLGVLYVSIRWPILYRRAKRQSSSTLPPSPRLESAIPREKVDAPILDHLSVTTVDKPTSKLGPKRVVGNKDRRASRHPQKAGAASGPSFIKPVIFFASLTASTEAHARWLSEQLRAAAQEKSSGSNQEWGLLPPEIYDLSEIDFEDHFISAPKPPPNSPNTRYVYCFLIPTYNIDTIIDTFLAHLDETHNDFRIDTAPLSNLAGYSVFGFGDKEGWPTEDEGFCSQAKELDRWMAKLTGKKRAYPLGLGDSKSDGVNALKDWTSGLTEILLEIAETGGLGEGVAGSGDPLESDEESAAEDEGETSRKKKQTIVDLEDINFAGGAKKRKGDPLPVDFTTVSKAGNSQPVLKEMVPSTSPTYASLTKQGYTIVGSHSGVKICRWTKSALRGRGSCYKYSFYGIKSHLCMETTPSLSCSNKCVFCWRHGTNPVGTTWRWKVDPPEMIFNGVKEGHYKKIKMLKGVPGVRAERFAEAMRIRHCALSLVGEPIFYPHINEFLGMLHNEQISSFLVCNAQHPDQLATLNRVTQLYVSIDASNRDSLRRIDRPLHRDFWERFQRCLDILREKRHVQRTVFRLTLVKGFNVEDEVKGYADLVEKGLPCFIEVKGVTYCGTSSSAGAGLTMRNVPYYEEVIAFVVALKDELERRGLGYGIGAEHAHSCCILLASERFHVDGKWHTRIDYDRFFELLEKEKTEGISFRPEDYMRETEEWALWGNGGFDPNDQRVRTKGKNKDRSIEQVTPV
ncbi:flavodoxin and radical SAM domain protein [Talaromyces stipitatus ATCC 10500]|uniref:S-adenosyl-L-methionine-dependent tRNA 4-demethylwyosine synthase n=1 Tax=Talaromyces stipitatus (strain ATCC 10500 / CBS 375.48 / QM 6759 / NRRL 1006) TaxID=441959 RepID=B8MEQ3_TALSN|nr:flavodoxin and radical SAM domain protein [Talaromyces stipitatus ATCC 10500]EED16936.1 flavodoxin and radical SAM domain protein [Talaromyces stipitatus ATCC 10500]